MAPIEAEFRNLDLPTCPRCDMKVETVKYRDYGIIRVVYHADMGCILGVVKAE